MKMNPYTRDTLLQALKELDEARQALDAIYQLSDPASNRDDFPQNFGALAKAIAKQIGDPWVVLHEWVHEQARGAEDAPDEEGEAL